MTNIFPAIQNVHYQLTGWCSWHKAQTLAAAVIALRPDCVVEIGVWGGKSLIPMAMALREVNPTGVVYGIDPWKAVASVDGQLNPADKEWWNDQGKHDFAHAEFLKYRRITQLEDVIQVLRMTSDEAPIPPDGIGILSLDGNHGEQALKDVRKFAPEVKLGGLVFLDDLQWTGGAVQDSVNVLKSFGFVELYVVTDPETQNQWGAYQRVRQ